MFNPTKLKLSLAGAIFLVASNAYAYGFEITANPFGFQPWSLGIAATTEVATTLPLPIPTLADAEATPLPVTPWEIADLNIAAPSENEMMHGAADDEEKECVCGDGIVHEESEECDDGNTDDKDGCHECKIQTGFICAGSPSHCEPAILNISQLPL